MVTSSTQPAMQAKAEPGKRVHAEAGFNLIETAIVLGIVGLVVGGIWAAAAGAYESMRQQKASEEVLALAQAVRSVYAQPGAPSIFTAPETLTDFKTLGIPSDMINSAGDGLTDPWGHAVTLAPGATAGTFTLQYTTMPVTSCINFVTKLANVGTGTGLQTIGGAAGATTVDLTSGIGAAIAPTAGATGCPANGTGAPYIVFSLR